MNALPPSSRFAISTTRQANDLLNRISVAQAASYFSQRAPMEEIHQALSSEWTEFVSGAAAKGVVLGGPNAHPKVAAVVQAVQSALAGFETQISHRFGSPLIG